MIGTMAPRILADTDSLGSGRVGVTKQLETWISKLYAVLEFMRFIFPLVLSPKPA
jgi:hypothetical protein